MQKSPNIGANVEPTTAVVAQRVRMAVGLNCQVTAYSEGILLVGRSPPCALVNVGGHRTSYAALARVFVARVARAT